MYKKGAGNDKQGKDAGNRTLCPYRNFSQAINGNTKPDFFVRPELARAVHISEGCVFPSTDQLTRLVNSLSHGIIIFKALIEEISTNAQIHNFQYCFNVYQSLLSHLKVTKTETAQNFHLLSTQ